MVRPWKTALCFLLLAGTVDADEPDPAQSVFRQPRVQVSYGLLMKATQPLFRSGDHVGAEKKCREAIKLAPHYPDAHYNLACALARQGKKKDALDSLEQAVARGYNNARHIKEDPDLENLRSEGRFPKLVAEAEKAKPLLLWPTTIEPGLVEKGEGWVRQKNTSWDLRNGVFRTFFKLPPRGKDVEVVKGFGEAGNLLRKWYRDGTAAGNHGDLYDNHDGDHSNMNYAAFPQLTRIEFDKEVQTARMHSGLQGQFFYNSVVLGNSSTALVGGPFWRSQTRLAYAQPRLMRILYNQYVGNHLYVYPEHRDHDFRIPPKERNGKESGHGDVYPANTPYVITSQGSSGSDRVFLDAVACTLAAFRPETKQLLARHGMLMPVVQMVFRSSNKNVKKPEDYLTGKAHPTVFDGGNVDVLQMVKAAQGIKADEVSPMVKLRVVKEDRPVLGRDYFDAEERGEQLFDTPAAIARVMRSTQYTRQMVVSAEGSRDLNKRPLTWRWVVLRGDEKGVTIRPLNKEGSVVELTVFYQERRPIAPDSKMESNRIDVGVFAYNGKHFSAPGFVTFFSLDNQKRVYDEKKRIKTVDYAGKEVSENYVDPLVDVQKDWRDEYRYDEQGRLLGWTRTRGKETQEFTPDGALVLTRDKQGRPETARVVRYGSKPRPGKAPLLGQQPGDTVMRYEYTADDDRVGRVKSREKAGP